MQIDMNFVEDARAAYAAELQNWGYGLPSSTGDANKDAHNILVDYWNARARRIEAGPRTVHWSPELRAREPGLPQAIRNGLIIVEQEVQAGMDMTARLSRQLPRCDFNDQMFNDWGVHHLHLHDVNRSGGTREILFVLVRPGDAYFLDVRPHGRGHYPWVDDDIVEIIHTNWPHEIARFRHGGARLATTLTRQQRRNLRSRNANAAVQMTDGTVYGATGGGMVGSGANIRAIMWSDFILGTARDVADWVNANADLVADTIEHACGVRPDRVKLGLAELAPDHAKILVESVSPPFWFAIPIEQPPKVTIEPRSTATAPER